MSQTSSYIEDSNFTDNFVNPTTDVWLDGIEPLQSFLFEPWYYNRLSQLPFRQIESQAAFEDDELLKQTIPDEIRIGEWLNNVIESQSKEPPKSSYFFCASVHLPMAKPLGRSLFQTEFTPDFFNIKRYVQGIMESSPVSQVEQEQISQGKNISVVIHPEVFDEVEKNAVTQDLETGIMLAQEIYSNLMKIEVSIEYDPEILERKSIRFALTVSGELETILQNEALFKQHLFSHINHRICQLITVTYEWEE